MLLPKSKSKIVVYTYTNSQCMKITKNVLACNAILYRKVQGIHCWKKQNSFNGFSPKVQQVQKDVHNWLWICVVHRKRLRYYQKPMHFNGWLRLQIDSFPTTREYLETRKKKPPRFLLFSNNISRTISPPLPHPRRLRRGKTKAIVEIFRGLAKNAIFLGKEN